MDFLKKNWSKIILAILAILGAVAFLISLLDLIDKKEEFATICYSIMGLVFFLGTAAYLICKMLNQKWAKYVMLATGVINTIFVCIFLFGTVGTMGTEKINGLDMLFGKKIGTDPYSFTFGGIKNMNPHIAPMIGFTITAALFPLVKGIKKVVCGCCQEEKKTATASSAPAAKK